MDFFSILCTTCKTRLKVRDEGAVGKILACPKCGGMVMVKPPAQWEATADEQGSTRTAIPNSASGTQPMLTLGDPSAFDDVEDLLAGKTPTPAPPAPTNAAPAPQANKTSTTPAKTAAAKPQGAPHAVAPPATAPSAPSNPPIPVAASKATVSNPPPLAEEPPLRPDWEANRPWRYWFSLSCAGLAGTLLALVVVMVTIRWFQQRPALAQSPSTPPVTNVSENNVPTPESSSPESPTTETESSEPSADAATTAAPESTPSSDEPSTSAPAKTSTKPSTESEDPLGLVPKGESTPQAGSLDTLNKVGKLLGEPKLAEEPKAEEKPLPLPVDSDPSPVPAAAALPRPEPRKIDVAARLADKLPEIKADDVPLSAFLQLIQELSTVPITLEPESLIWVRGTPSMPVSIHVANNTIGDVLKAALAPLKLEPQVLENQVVVTLPARLVTIPYPVGDLTAGDASQLAALAEMVRDLIEPESWKTDGGAALTEKKDTLEVKHLPSVQLQILTLMEKLRVSRGLAPRSKFDPAMFRVVSRSERAKSKLERPVSLNFSQPTSLISILRQLGAAGDMEILIDWRSLCEEGWTPDTVATLVADKQPLGEALAKMLQPMDLAVRVIDERTLQVVSASDLSEHVELELYPLADWLAEESAEMILTELQTAVGDDALRSGGGKGHLLVDGASKHLIALLTQPQQRAIAALIAERRTKTK